MGRTKSLTSVVVIATRFWVLTWIVFVLRGLVGVVLGCSTIVAASSFMQPSVSVPSHDLFAWGNILGNFFVWFLKQYSFRQLLFQIVLLFQVSCVLALYPNRYQRLANLSPSRDLAYKSSCVMVISGSGFHSQGVTCTSGMGCRGVN